MPVCITLRRIQILHRRVVTGNNLSVPAWIRVQQQIAAHIPPGDGVQRICPLQGQDADERSHRSNDRHYAPGPIAFSGMEAKLFFIGQGLMVEPAAPLIVAS